MRSALGVYSANWSGVPKTPDGSLEIGQRNQPDTTRSTGVNARASNAVGMELVFGERPPNPSDLDEPVPPDGFHPEIVALLGYSDEDIIVRVNRRGLCP